MAEPDLQAGRGRTLGSRLLSELDQRTSRPLTALTIVVAAIVWIIISVAIGFPVRWESIFQSLVAALTLAMVFVIQHTQARQQAATQRKLDEILQALPGADNALMTLEHASAADWRAPGDSPREIRQAALDVQPD